ncbi:MAG: sensor histidine kinase [Gammaproteobacteria bacterium]
MVERFRGLLLEQGVQLTRQFARTAVSVFLVKDLTAIRHTAKVFLQFPGVRYLGVVDTKTVLRFEEGRPNDWSRQALPGTVMHAGLAAENRERWHFVAPIMTTAVKSDTPFLEGNSEDARVIGYAHVDIDKQSLRSLVYVLVPLNVAVWIILTLAVLRWQRNLSELERQKSLFLATVTHEMRTPLNAIHGNAQLVLEAVQVYEEMPDATKVETIINSAQQLAALIENMLTAQKLDAGTVELQLAPTDLRDVVGEAVDTVMPSIETNGNRLSQIVQANGLVTIDKTKVSQILMNLLSNAGKCTQQGQITLILKQTTRRLFIQVRDTGKGIPGDQPNRIFEWFRKVETSDASQYGGSGLGLAISKGFCELMGGTISVESRVDVGSTFTVVIPLPVTATPDR